MTDRPPKRPSDYVGCIVRSTVALRNGIGELPSGTEYFVSRSYAGLHLNSRPCECCGLSMRIKRVPVEDVEFVRRVREKPAGPRPIIYDRDVFGGS